MRRKTKYNRIVATFDNALEKRGMYKTEMKKKIIEIFGLKNKTAKNYLRIFLLDFRDSVAKIQEPNGQREMDFYMKTKELYFKLDENQRTISEYNLQNIIYL